MSILIAPSVECVKTLIDSIRPFSEIFVHDIEGEDWARRYDIPSLDCNFNQLLDRHIKFLSSCGLSTQIKIIDKVIDYSHWTGKTYSFANIYTL